MSSSSTNGTDVDLRQNRGHQTEVIWYTISGFATLAIGMRFYVRYRIRAIGLDDWSMLIAWILLLLSTGLIVWFCSLGGNGHLEAIAPKDLPHVLELLWLLQIPAITSLGFAKVSIGWLILRIIGSSNAAWQKRVVYILMITVFLANVIACVLLVAQCSPLKALWTSGIPSKCWNPKIQGAFAIASSVWNAAVDLIFALLPISIVRKLQLSKKRKIELSVILGLGLFTFICATIKASYLTFEANRGDVTWNSYFTFSWFAAEIFLLIVLGSVPPIKPLFDAKFKKVAVLSNSYELSSMSKMKGSYQTHSRGVDIESANESDPPHKTSDTIHIVTFE